jgi:DNA helicase-2/ATP-dependent DNA helicase PcrA
MGAAEEILSSLNDAQRAAAVQVRGPVVILAGAGTGKTTTITHRIAYQVATGTFPADRILAVTFTEKAAGELQERLARARRQRRRSPYLPRGRALATRPPPGALHRPARARDPRVEGAPDLLPRQRAATALPVHAPQRAGRGDRVGEEPHDLRDTYLQDIQRLDHTPPIPAELMVGIFQGYERRKERTGQIDFEDMLSMTTQLLDEYPDAAAEVREHFEAITVDEYQDVNPLQQGLLERFLGDRDELCVVGDDYQTIYAFTGASTEYLLGFPQRYPNAHVVRLEENYRSTPQLLVVANGLAARMGGFEKKLRATRPEGPNPTARVLSDSVAEVAFVLGEARRLHRDGVAFEEMAVIYRINARSEPYEEAFAAAEVPYQVRDGAFLRRPGPRAVLAALRRPGSGTVAELVDAATDAVGYDPDTLSDDAEEITRQADLGRLRALATEYRNAAADGGSVDGFVTELSRRFSTQKKGRGVNLLTYHRAKGLEFEAVFLPRLLDNELPFRSQRASADPDEERRLLYVGITRARRHLYLSWPREPRTQPSRFLEELGITPPPQSSASSRNSRTPVKVSSGGGVIFDRLKAWRKKRATTDGVPAYLIFHDKTLAEIAERKPRDWADLASIPGVGPAKLERYADDLLAVVASG